MSRVRQYISEATDIVDWVHDNFTDYTFPDVDTIVIDAISVELETRRFDNLISLYGLQFVLMLVEYYEEHKEYEICGLIKSQIEYLNEHKGMKYATRLENFLAHT